MITRQASADMWKTLDLEFVWVHSTSVVFSTPYAILHVVDMLVSFVHAHRTMLLL